MRRKRQFLLLLSVFVFINACKKEAEPEQDYLSMKVNGEFHDINIKPAAYTYGSNIGIQLRGLEAIGVDTMWFQLDLQTLNTLSVGTYTDTTFFEDPRLAYHYLAGSNGGVFSNHGSPGAPDYFSFTITTVAAKRVKGTFKGHVWQSFSNGTRTKALVSEGRFNLPILY